MPPSPAVSTVLAGLWPPDEAQVRSARRTPAWKTLLQVLGGGAVGAGVTFAGLSLLPSVAGVASPLLALLAFMVGLLFGGWLQVVLHELGHALAGLLVGMRLVVLGVGPLRLQRGRDGRWRGHRSRGLQGVGGFAVSLPRDNSPPTRPRESVFLLGGVAANLMLGVLALWLARSGHVGVLAASALGGFGVVGLALAVVNLLPLSSAGWASDGRVLLDLWRGHPDARVVPQIRQLVGLALANVRPRDWPASLIPDPTTVVDERLRAQAESMCLSWAVDRGDGEAACAIAERIVADWAREPDGLRQMLAPAIAAVVVRFLDTAPGAPALVRAWRTRSGGALFDQTATLAWLDAELALMEGRNAEARTLLRQSREALPRCVLELDATLLAESLDRLQARLDAKADAERDANEASVLPATARPPLASAAPGHA